MNREPACPSARPPFWSRPLLAVAVGLVALAATSNASAQVYPREHYKIVQRDVLDGRNPATLKLRFAKVRYRDLRVSDGWSLSKA